MEGFTYYFTYEETICHRPHRYYGMPCALGADMSRGDDFCAFTFLFPLQDGCFGVKTICYITELTLNKLTPALRTKYQEFIDEGSLMIMNGSILDMDEVYEDLDSYIITNNYDVRCFGYDPYNAKGFVDRWERENSAFGVVKVIQGARTESVPLGEIKNLAEERMLIFDQLIYSFTMGNCITLIDTNGNKKLLKKKADEKIDCIAATIDAMVAYKENKDAFY